MLAVFASISINSNHIFLLSEQKKEKSTNVLEPILDNINKLMMDIFSLSIKLNGIISIQELSFQLPLIGLLEFGIPCQKIKSCLSIWPCKLSMLSGHLTLPLFLPVQLLTKFMYTIYQLINTENWLNPSQ